MLTRQKTFPTRSAQPHLRPARDQQGSAEVRSPASCRNATPEPRITGPTMLLLDGPNPWNFANITDQSASSNTNVATLRDTETSASLDHAPAIALTIAYHSHLERIGQRHIFSFTNEPTELSREKQISAPPRGPRANRCVPQASGAHPFL